MSANRDELWQPGKLRSLWDMLEFEGRAVVMALEGLYKAERIGGSDPAWPFGDNRIEFWLNLLDAQLVRLGCSQTRKKVFYMQRTLIANPLGTDLVARFAQFQNQFSEMINRLEDELEDQKLYCIVSRDAEFLGSVSQVYGDAVAARFNDQLFDLEEASKAVAFGRGTSAVFHLMRAMEGAVSLAGEKLGVTIVDKHDRELEWGKVVANMKAPIEAMDKGNPTKSDWSEVQTLLFHVKDAWRNTTMHPKQTYTLEEAQEVLAATRAFLRRLAPLI